MARDSVVVRVLYHRGLTQERLTLTAGSIDYLEASPPSNRVSSLGLLRFRNRMESPSVDVAQECSAWPRECVILQMVRWKLYTSLAQLPA